MIRGALPLTPEQRELLEEFREKPYMGPLMELFTLVSDGRGRTLAELEASIDGKLKKAHELIMEDLKAQKEARESE